MDQRLGEAMNRIQRQKQESGINIRGKIYSMVQDRVEIFRQVFGSDYGIDTQITYPEGFDKGCVIVACAKVTNGEGQVVASGWASEIIGSSKFTTTSPIEVAETSAIGRALASFGLHGGEYASANEVQAAVRKEAYVRQEPRDEKTEMAPARTNGGPNQGTGFYVPSDHDVAWMQPDIEQKKIIDQLGKVDDGAALGHYWNELKGFRAALKQDHPHLFAEMKAAFVQSHNRIGTNA
jgi:hypothetical protein